MNQRQWDLRWKFQPAPPQGGRPADSNVSIGVAIRFNPRPRKGGDYCHKGMVLDMDVFQPAPPQGGRHGFELNRPLSTLFQPAPPQGGRPGLPQVVLGADLVSTRAPRKGGDFLWRSKVATGPTVSTRAPVSMAT